MTDDKEMNDVEFEMEDSPESNTHEKLLEKVAKLKEDLKKSNAERLEYLDGWQRMRADVANMKRDHSTLASQMGASAKEDVISDLIPILDSFDMAMQGEGWNSVDAAWRKGVEYIRGQCISALERHGVSTFGKAGEQFDPSIHESVQEVADGSAPDTIVRVLRQGYRIKDKLIRPAQVVVSKK